MLKKIGIFFQIIILSNLTNLLYGQYSFAMETVPNHWHGGLLNPSSFPTNKSFVFSLPSLQAGMQFSPFSIFKSSSNTSIDIHLDQTIQSMDSLNKIDFGVQLNPISFGFKLGENKWIGAGYRLVSRAMLQFSKSAALLAYNGNEPFIGQNLTLNTGFDALAYQEFFLQIGFNSANNENIYWGLKLKVLGGLTYIQTLTKEASLYTHPEDYNLSAKINYVINSSSLDIEKPFSNMGAAIDLGIRFQSENVTLSAAIIDLGMIQWPKSEQISINNTFEFNGLPLLKTGKTIDANFNQWVDSVKKEVVFTQQNLPFKSFLPIKFLINGRYSLSNSSHLMGYLFLENYANKMMFRGGLGYLFQLSSILDLGVSLNFNDHLQLQVGNQLGIRLKRIELFGSLENWGSLLSKSKKTQGISGQVGINYFILSGENSKRVGKGIMNEKKFFKK